MTEENKVVVETTPVGTETTTTPTQEVKVVQEVKAPELTPIEKQALEMGWRPKEEFLGEDEDFIDAQEFVRRKPLFDKIDSVGRELKETRKALKAIQAHYEKVKETEYNHALKTLKEEKKKALEDGDADRLIEIDEQIADTKAMQREEIQIAQQEAKKPHPNFLQWVDKNRWYASDIELRKEADRIGLNYSSEYPEKSPDEVLMYVSGRIKKFFPEKFTNPNKTRPSPVEGGSSHKSPGKENESNDDDDSVILTDDERKAMNTFIKQGILTKDQYLKDIKRLRGL